MECGVRAGISDVCSSDLSGLSDYYGKGGEGGGHYAKGLSNRGYNFSRHYMPHDADHKLLTKNAESRKWHAEQAGIRPIEVLKRIDSLNDGVDASRAFLAPVYIDE